MLAFAIFCSLQVAAQHYDMTRWGADRGYTQAPYWRYEADNNYCETNGNRLQQTDDQLYVQSEASNQQAVELSNGQYVRWTNDTGDANGVTMRYSIPYHTTAVVGIYVDGRELGRMSLNTDHFWEWNPSIKGSRSYKPEFYSTHGNPKSWARMRFSEELCLLSDYIRQGQTFEVRHISGANVTVDFVEIEKAVRVEKQSDWVEWDGSNIQEFVWAHQGQTIYVGRDVEIGATLNMGSARLQGAGIFYTHITFPGAGFGAFGTSVRDMRISCKISQRYPNMGDSESPGSYADCKCFNGNSSGLIVERVLVENFTCGGWFDGSNNMTLRHCRVRNNYADGVNFCNGSSNNLVEQCDFRNNGDDDIASWSNGGNSQNNRVVNVTCEHNWRASSIGWFGGGNHSVRNVLIKDGMENGIRLVSDFGGTGFNAPMTYENVSIVHQACISGDPGRHGDFWGVDEGAFHIEGSKNYDIQGAVLKNVDIYDSRGNAVFIGSTNNRTNNLKFENVTVHGVRDGGSYAFYFENPKGNAVFDGVGAEDINANQLTNINGGQLVSSSLNNGQFNLEVNQNVSIPDGFRVKVSGISWRLKLPSRAADINDGDKVILAVKIENNSSEHLPEGLAVSTHLKLDGTAIALSNITSLKAGESRVLETEWTATAGGHTLTAEIDPSNVLNGHAEAYTVTKKFNVNGSGQTADDWHTLPFVDNSNRQAVGLLWRNETKGETTFGRGPVSAGDRIQWAGVIANNSGSDFSSGEKLGVQYLIDGKGYDQALVSWNDTPGFSLPNGSRQLFPTTGGGSSATGNNESYKYWTATDGDHTINVLTDDQNKHGGTRTYSFPLKVPFGGEVTALFPEEELTDPDNFDGISTSLDTLTSAPVCVADDSWYGLDGRRYTNHPSIPGLYIHHNKKILVH